MASSFLIEGWQNNGVGVTFNCTFPQLRSRNFSERSMMSEQKQDKPKVPDGHTRFVTTKQKKPNKKGFVGYETIWEPWQKEVEYTTPKKP